MKHEQHAAGGWTLRQLPPRPDVDASGASSRDYKNTLLQIEARTEEIRKLLRNVRAICWHK